MGGGDTARSDDMWSESWDGGWGAVGDINDDDELDRACTVDACQRGAVDLDTVRCQSGLSPDGLFRSVGRTSSMVLYPFVRLRALC